MLYLLKTASVYFNVQKNVSFFNPESLIPFDILNINVGGAFDLKGQKFTSPIAEIFEFIVKGFKIGNNEEMSLSMRLNGTPVANTSADYLGNHLDTHYNHSFNMSFSIYSILILEKGDQIDLFLK